MVRSNQAQRNSFVYWTRIDHGCMGIEVQQFHQFHPPPKEQTLKILLSIEPVRPPIHRCSLVTLFPGYSTRHDFEHVVNNKLRRL